MRFDLDQLRQRSFEKQDKIAADYDIAVPPWCDSIRHEHSLATAC